MNGWYYMALDLDRIQTCIGDEEISTWRFSSVLKKPLLHILKLPLPARDPKNTESNLNLSNRKLFENVITSYALI